MARQAKPKGLFAFDSGKKIVLGFRMSEQSPNIKIAESRDGSKFLSSSKLVELHSGKEKSESWKGTDGFRATIGEKYTILSFLKKTPSGTMLVIASSGNGASWKRVGTLHAKHPSVVLETGAKKKSYLAFSATGRKSIVLSVSTDLVKWKEYGIVLEAREHSFDVASLVPLSAMQTKAGIALIYTAKNQSGLTTIGSALFDIKDPERILWRGDSPLFTAPGSWYGGTTTLLGGASIGRYFYGYFQRDGEDVESFPMPRLWESFIAKKAVAKKSAKGKKSTKTPIRKKTAAPSDLVRYEGNPIIEPNAANSWEAFAAFNPAALHLDDRVHLLYRAQGYDGVSTLGYASSRNGIEIDERLSDPAFVPSNPFDTRRKSASKRPYAYVSGGGYGGCEDPRLCQIEDTIYLIYVAFNGATPPGIALSSIAIDDFLAKNWTWTEPRLISEPGKIQKNWVIFPEKIRGKFAVLHGISPKISIEYVDSLDNLGEGNHIESLPPHGGRGYYEPGRHTSWDNIVRGAGAPPIRTDRGWLVLYHAMDYRDPGKYKIGAMLLDLENPETILHRSPKPLLEPETHYENNGHKRGVIYTCGAVIKDGKLFVYYGASDRAAAVATAPIDQFLDDLLSDKAPKLKKVTIQ
jgi:predicted GH43/DUF377 family glycosyl hydrolase